MAVQLGSMAVGDIVKIKENGSPVEYIIIQKGSPSADYAGFENGVVLLRKDIHSLAEFDAVEDGYEDSDLNEWCNGPFLNTIEESVRDIIMTVRIPYRAGSSGNTVYTGNGGLACKAFALSTREVDTSPSWDVAEGTAFSYFLGGGNAKRIAYYNGNAEEWWLRTPDVALDLLVFKIERDGSIQPNDGAHISSNFGRRPALVLPASVNVNDSGTVSTNQPPEAPASITVPEEIQGGVSVTISWAVAADPDGNLEGYILERSIDGGSGWQQVYQGPATSTTNTVAFGTQSVIYRVKAYDAAGAESGWRTSEQVTVINNNAPAAPGSITVPNLVKGGEPLAISWAAASDPDENLTGYELERKTDAADWAQVYKGEGLSFTDQITKGWLSVQYRVRALDSYNAASGWTESDARTVDNNSAPVITCEHPSGSDLGEKAEDFTIPYSVTDADGDPVTVTEAMDGTQLRQFAAEQGAENALSLTGESFLKLLNGAHSLEITAADGKAETAHSLTFTKNITSASVTLAEPLAVEGDITLAALRVSGSIPADALYTVEVTNNGNDDQPVWQDATDEVNREANIVFANHTAVNGAAFNFRVSVARGPSGEGGYIRAITGAFQ